MNIKSNFSMVMSADNSKISIMGTKGTREVLQSGENFNAIRSIYTTLRRYSEDNRGVGWENLCADIKKMIECGNPNWKVEYLEPFVACGIDVNGIDIKVDTADNSGATEKLSDNALIENAIKKLMDFFAEFSFEPNFRFINTLAINSQKSMDNAKKYVLNYFALTDNGDYDNVKRKIGSMEFKSIVGDFKAVKPTHTVNNRFKIYYGSQGTGKTTKAMEETGGRCVVCNNSMLPADLMEDFTFQSGNATFQHSELWNCMENGLPLVLDEINLLPFESLRFLQTILDNKKSFVYKGQTVNIKDGFSIIGTMNLRVNGSTFGLPEPLVDRGLELVEFKLTPKQLINSIL